MTESPWSGNSNVTIACFPEHKFVGRVAPPPLLSPREPPDRAGDTDGWSPPRSLLKSHIVHRIGEIADASVRADS